VTPKCPTLKKNVGKVGHFEKIYPKAKKEKSGALWVMNYNAFLPA